MPIWYCYILYCSNDNQGRWRTFIAYNTSKAFNFYGLALVDFICILERYFSSTVRSYTSLGRECGIYKPMKKKQQHRNNILRDTQLSMDS